MSCVIPSWQKALDLAVLVTLVPQQDHLSSYVSRLCFICMIWRFDDQSSFYTRYYCDWRKQFQKFRLNLIRFCDDAVKKKRWWQLGSHNQSQRDCVRLIAKPSWQTSKKSRLPLVYATRISLSAKGLHLPQAIRYPQMLYSVMFHYHILLLYIPIMYCYDIVSLLHTGSLCWTCLVRVPNWCIPNFQKSYSN